MEDNREINGLSIITLIIIGLVIFVSIKFAGELYPQYINLHINDTMLAVLASWAGVLAAFINSGRQLKEARNANRAMIGVSSVKALKVVEDKTLGHVLEKLTISASIFNYGKTPAYFRSARMSVLFICNNLPKNNGDNCNENKNENQIMRIFSYDEGNMGIVNPNQTRQFDISFDVVQEFVGLPNFDCIECEILIFYYDAHNTKIWHRATFKSEDKLKEFQLEPIEIEVAKDGNKEGITEDFSEIQSKYKYCSKPLEIIRLNKELEQYKN